MTDEIRSEETAPSSIAAPDATEVSDGHDSESSASPAAVTEQPAQQPAEESEATESNRESAQPEPAPAAPEAASEPEPVQAEAPAAEPEPAAPVAAVEAPTAEPAAAPQPSDDYSRSFPSLNEGDVVQGTVVHIDREGVLVDVGTKSEGIIRRNELSRDTSTPAEDIVKVGERISV